MEKAVILSEPSATLSEAKNLTAKDLEIDFSTQPGSGLNGAGIRGEAEESLVREAVERCNGNISAAAKMLGISRPTMYAKMKKYGL